MDSEVTIDINIGYCRLKKPDMTQNMVIGGVLARLTGLMKDWFVSLGSYRQRQWANTQDNFFNNLH